MTHISLPTAVAYAGAATIIATAVILAAALCRAASRDIPAPAYAPDPRTTRTDPPAPLWVYRSQQITREIAVPNPTDDLPVGVPEDEPHTCRDGCPCWWVSLLDEDQTATTAEEIWNCTKRGAR